MQLVSFLFSVSLTTDGGAAGGAASHGTAGGTAGGAAGGTAGGAASHGTAGGTAGGAAGHSSTASGGSAAHRRTRLPLWRQLVAGLLLWAGALTLLVTVPFAAHPFAAHAQPERWLPPVPPPLVVGRKFDPPPKHWQAGHRGVDLCVAVGTPVRAPRAGTVVYAGKLVDRQVVSIAHEGGLRSTFEPLSPTVSVGQTIPAGTVVGTLEPGHEGDCLHWGVKRGRHEYLNPLLLVIGEVRLLPWED